MSGSESPGPLAETDVAVQHSDTVRHADIAVPRRAGARAIGAGRRAAGEGRESGLERESRIATDARLAGWVEAHGEELERHLLRMTLRAEDARDVLQEVWVTALRSPPDDGPGSNPRAWLYRVATRRALDVLARDRRHRELLAERSERVAPDPETLPDAWVGQLTEETRARVRACVARLPQRQREAVWLRWLEGCDYETIAARLGGSADTARANVYQGLKRLRTQLCRKWLEEIST